MKPFKRFLLGYLAAGVVATITMLLLFQKQEPPPPPSVTITDPYGWQSDAATQIQLGKDLEEEMISIYNRDHPNHPYNGPRLYTTNKRN